MNPAETYEQYFVPAIFVPWTRVLLEHAAPSLGQHVLDVGCGTGIVSRSVAPLVGTAGRVVAVDLSQDMLTVAQYLPSPAGASIEWRRGNATALGLPDQAFDLVLCQHGLQFFADRDAAAGEMRRVLKADGRVALSVWQALSLHSVYEALLGATARQLGTDVGTVAHAWSLGDVDELQLILDSAGFRRVRIAQLSLSVSFPSPERFVELTILGGATTIPAFAELDGPQRSALVEAVKQETDAVLRRHRDKETVVFPMFAHVAVAYA